MSAPSPLDHFDAELKTITVRRGDVYGHPCVDFDHVARLKRALPHCKDPRIQHALEMICVKLVRAATTPEHIDSWIDIAGYARTAVMIIDREQTTGVKNASD